MAPPPRRPPRRATRCRRRGQRKHRPAGTGAALRHAAIASNTSERFRAKLKLERKAEASRSSLRLKLQACSVEAWRRAVRYKG
eukprot:9474651-Pyramimonas_sp.AAC.3